MRDESRYGDVDAFLPCLKTRVSCLSYHEKLRNDSNITSRVFVAKNDYLGKWNYRSIPKLKI
jgi:hypothetical protein